MDSSHLEDRWEERSGKLTDEKFVITHRLSALMEFHKVMFDNKLLRYLTFIICVILISYSYLSIFWDRPDDYVQITSDQGIYRIEISPDGKWIAAQETIGHVSILSMSDFDEVFEIQSDAHDSTPFDALGISWSPDGRKLAVATVRSDDPCVEIWDTSQWSLIETLNVDGRRIHYLEWSPNGTKLACSASWIWIWDTGSWDLERRLAGSIELQGISWNPLNDIFAAGTAGGKVFVYDTNTWERIQQIHAHGDFEQTETSMSWTGMVKVVWVADGKYLVSASSGPDIKVWNAQDFTLETTLEEHEGWIHDLAWSSDEKVFASVSGGGLHPDPTKSNAIILWDTTSWEPQSRIHIFMYGIDTITFSPDGENIYAGSTDGKVREWDSEKGHGPDLSFPVVIIIDITLITVIIGSTIRWKRRRKEESLLKLQTDQNNPNEKNV